MTTGTQRNEKKSNLKREEDYNNVFEEEQEEGVDAEMHLQMCVSNAMHKNGISKRHIHRRTLICGV